MAVAFASQSLDDSSTTEARTLKIAGLNASNETPNGGAMYYRKANNAHALGVSFADSEAVAQNGISLRQRFLFGLGLHTVGDFLAHANLSGEYTVGHQNGTNEDCSESRMLISDADYTYKNPFKALDTIARFQKLWSAFLNKKVVQLSIFSQQSFANFVMSQAQDKKEEAFRIWTELNGVPRAHFDEAVQIWKTDSLTRNGFWTDSSDRGKPWLFNAGARRQADTLAWSYWSSRPNDALLRSGVDDVHLAAGAWGQAFGGYSKSVSRPRVCQMPDPSLFGPPLPPYPFSGNW
jgi:hypothetical protein